MELDYELIGHLSRGAGTTLEVIHEGRPVSAAIRRYPHDERGTSACRLEFWWRSTVRHRTDFFYLEADWTDVPDGSSQPNDDPGTSRPATFKVRLGESIGTRTDIPDLTGLTDTRSLQEPSARHRLPSLRQEVEWAFVAVSCITRLRELTWVGSIEGGDQNH